MPNLAHTVQEEVLERLAGVGVAARHAVESVLSGHHRSIRHGLSVEFAGHREYQPGDDIRHLDWLVWARSDRLDVRLYEEETRLRAWLVVDCSGSMAYQSQRRSKLEYARMLAAALGFVMVRQSDAVGLALVDTDVREMHPPASTMGHLLNLLDRLQDTPPGGETSLAGVLDTLAARLKSRGLVILITDAFDDPERITQALQHLRFRKQDVRVLVVTDPHEDEFLFKGMHEFRGLEGEKALKLDADRVRHSYREVMAEHCRKLAAGCHAANVSMDLCRTDEDLADVLVRALAGAWIHPGARR